MVGIFLTGGPSITTTSRLRLTAQAQPSCVNARATRSVAYHHPTSGYYAERAPFPSPLTSAHLVLRRPPTRRLAKILDAVQSEALRLICDTFRTTLAHTLQVISHVSQSAVLSIASPILPPRRCSRSTCRYLFFQRLPGEWRMGHYFTTRTPVPTPPF